MSTPKFKITREIFRRRPNVLRALPDSRRKGKGGPWKRSPLCVGEGRYVPESWGLHLQLVLLHLVQAGDDHARQGKQRNDVGQDDQVIEHVGKLPDEVAAGDGAQEDEHQRDDGIDDAAQLAVMK